MIFIIRDESLIHRGTVWYVIRIIKNVKEHRRLL